MGVFKALVQEPDLEWEFIDGSIIKAHQHSAGAANDQDQGMGKSVAGNTTKIPMAVDAYGLPIEFLISNAVILCLYFIKSAKRDALRWFYNRSCEKSLAA